MQHYILKFYFFILVFYFFESEQVEVTSLKNKLKPLSWFVAWMSNWRFHQKYTKILLF